MNIYYTWKIIIYLNRRWHTIWEDEIEREGGEIEKETERARWATCVTHTTPSQRHGVVNTRLILNWIVTHTKTTEPRGSSTFWTCFFPHTSNKVDNVKMNTKLSVCIRDGERLIDEKNKRFKQLKTTMCNNLGWICLWKILM